MCARTHSRTVPGNMKDCFYFGLLSRAAKPQERWGPVLVRTQQYFLVISTPIGELELAGATLEMHYLQRRHFLCT